MSRVEGRLDYQKYDGVRPVYTEYNLGNYVRSLELSSQINRNGINADMKDGINDPAAPEN